MKLLKTHYPTIIALVVIIIFLLVVIKPKYYLAEIQAENLNKYDEVVIEDNSYIFQNAETLENDSNAKLVFLDSNSQSVTITILPNTLLIIKKSLPWWTMTPPPPPPSPVPVPIPVPTPINPSILPPIAPTPTPPVPTPPPVPPIAPPTPPPSPPAPPINYPPACYNYIWDVDESDMDCGGSCPQCLSSGIYTSCWDNSDCASGNCDISSAQRPLPASHIIQTIRLLAGQGWIIPYQGICK